MTKPDDGNVTIRYQIVTLRVPFTERWEQPPSTWDWSFIEAPGVGVTLLDCDPVSEDPNVQPLAQLSSEHSILCQQGNPDDDCGACDEQERDRWEPPATGPYWSRSASDAHESGACQRSYVDYLEIAALRHHIYFLRHGDPGQADLMMTRTFSESLMGNDGE